MSDRVVRLLMRCSVRTRELPDNYPYVVRTHYIEELVKQWKEPAEQYFMSVCDIVQNYAKNVIRSHFGRFTHSGLHGHIQ